MISIVMPAYNAERFVGAAIRSVLNQSLSDWELLVVDDGSTDGTADAVRRFTDARIRYFRTENRGTAGARNVGLGSARGEFVAFLDNDDLWFPRKLEIQLRVMEEDPSAVLVYTDLRLVDAEGRRLPSHRLPLSRRPTGRCLDRILVRNDVRAPSTVLARRSALMRAGLFEENLSGSDDWDLWVRLALEGTFRYIPRALAAYRVSPGQQSDRYEAMNRHAQEVIKRAFSHPEVRRRLTPGRLARLKRQAEAVLLYDMGWRAMRAGDLAGASGNLWRSLRRCPYDIRQPVMLGAALLARLPLIPRAAVLQAVRK